MCAKRTPRVPLSTETKHFIQHQAIITGQVLAARHWLKRHNFSLPSPN